jgi:phosphomannomutase/phosphoglucomutase
MGNISKDIFKAYDIRGEVGKDFIPKDAYRIGLGIGTQLQRAMPVARQVPQVLLGRDARVTSPEIAFELRKGLLETGCHITDLGIIPTPALYFALEHLQISNGLMITASHNPAHHNGIKMVFDDNPLSRDEIQQLYHTVQSERFILQPNARSRLDRQDILPAYQQAIVNDITLQRPFRIAIDGCNGVASLMAESLFTQLGCKVSPLYCELDGTFPNHPPDPTNPKHLQALQRLVREQRLDLGIAFDGDADRMIAIDGNGKIVWPDRMMILLANSILKTHPNASVVYDVKCSHLLPQAIEKAGGVALACRSGHSVIKSYMKKVNAIMGGEFSGHIILRDRWSCFDDALYNAARLLELLSEFRPSPTQVFSEIPDSYSTPEYFLYFDSATKARQVLALLIQQADFPLAKKTLIDGLRIDYDDCWGLVRSSNTTPTLTFRFEATTESRLNEIKNNFRDLLNTMGFTDTLPF